MRTPIEENDPEDNDPDADVKNVTIGGKNFNIRGKPSLHRSEKDTLERYINVAKQNKKDTKDTPEEREYYAGLLADKLEDHKSLTYYKIACRRFDSQLLLQKASEIMTDGGARNPRAVFEDWI